MCPHRVRLGHRSVETIDAGVKLCCRDSYGETFVRTANGFELVVRVVEVSRTVAETGAMTAPGNREIGLRDEAGSPEEPTSRQMLERVQVTAPP